MSLHARNIAVAAGAEGDEIERVVSRLRTGGHVRLDRAQAILDELRQTGA
jgi:hydroxymethylglutaryl-CoA reductase